MKTERRHPKFTERLSWFMAIASAFGGFYVLLDPILVLNISGHTVKVGGEGFSADLKGAVVSLILIGGWTAIKEYWLGASASGQTQSESMSRIAEASAPTTAAAVAAASAPIKAENVEIDANVATVNEVQPEKGTT